MTHGDLVRYGDDPRGDECSLCGSVQHIAAECDSTIPSTKVDALVESVRYASTCDCNHGWRGNVVIGTLRRCENGCPDEERPMVECDERMLRKLLASFVHPAPNAPATDAVTEQEIAELERLLALATPGPWAQMTNWPWHIVRDEQKDATRGASMYPHDDNQFAQVICHVLAEQPPHNYNTARFPHRRYAESERCRADAKLIALARNLLPLLLADWRRMREDKARLDWLEQQGRDAYVLTGVSEPSFGIASIDASDCKKGVSVVLTHGYADETIADSLREVIDAARAKDDTHV